MGVGAGLTYYLWTPLPRDLDQRGAVLLMAMARKMAGPVVGGTWFSQRQVKRHNKMV